MYDLVNSAVVTFLEVPRMFSFFHKISKWHWNMSLSLGTAGSDWGSFQVCPKFPPGKLLHQLIQCFVAKAVSTSAFSHSSPSHNSPLSCLCRWLANEFVDHHGVYIATALISSHTTLTTGPAQISFLYVTNSMGLATNTIRTDNFASFSLK